MAPFARFSTGSERCKRGRLSVKDEFKTILAQAEEKLRAARLLLDGNAWADASSRAYYAAFHAVSAALLSKGLTYSSHAQTLGAFNKEFVRPGIFPAEFTTLLTRLFEDRQSGDYDFDPGFTATEARQDIVDAERIVKAVQLFLESSEP